MTEHHLDAGLAFDGDADRCFAVDDKGNVFNGDCLMALFAIDMKSRGLLKKNTVVCTVMSNMGLDRFCEENEINRVITDVGDRSVMEAMIKGGYNIGGEQCGHIMLLDHTTSDDGQLTGAHLLSLIMRRKTKLSCFSGLIVRYPQTLINIRITPEGRKRFHQDKEIAEETERIRACLGHRGKIVVRVSGTEPLARVMVQGEDTEEIERYAQLMADFIRKRLC